MLVEDLDRRCTLPLRVFVGLVEQARSDVGAESARTVVDDRSVTGQQPEEVRLAGAVRPQHRDPLAVPELDIERIGESAQFEPFDHHGAFAGAGATEAHVDLLLAHLGRPFVLVEEVTQSRLGRLQLRSEYLADLRALSHLDDELFETLALLVVQRRVASTLVVVRPFGIGIRGEAAAVRPRSRRLDGHDLRRRGGEQLTIVADVQHRLLGRDELTLEPALRRDVEEVVGLVEHEHVIVSPQQVLEREPLLLAAAQGRKRSVGNAPEVVAEGPSARLVPGHFELVSAGVAPRCQGLCITHRLAVEPLLGRGEPDGGGTEPCGRERQEQAPHVIGCAFANVTHTDELVHDAEPPVDRDRPAGRRLLARDDAQQRCLAHAVRADQSDALAASDGERDITEELFAARQLPAEPGHLNRTHGRMLRATTARWRVRSQGPTVADRTASQRGVTPVLQ